MMKGGMGNMMKQAQMMQANMQKAQAELATTEVEGSASNGMVKITMTCNNEVKRVMINDARAKAEATSSARMSGMMPAGMKVPF